MLNRGETESIVSEENISDIDPTMAAYYLQSPRYIARAVYMKWGKKDESVSVI